MGQGIRIGPDATSSEASAILELDGSGGKGFLVPQITEIQRNNAAFIAGISASADNGEGILVYQTDGEQGLYYWEGARWMKYKPYGYVGIVGNNWDTLANGGVGAYAFSSFGTGFSASELGIGSYEVIFSSPFDTYPTITLTPESNKFPLPDNLPVPDVTCTPSFFANCTANFNSDQVEAVRVVSTVNVSSYGGIQTQVLQNGIGFLPALNSATVPAGYAANDNTPPEFVNGASNTNGCGWPQSWMTGDPALSTATPSVAQQQLTISGGCWNSTTDCILQVSDPCVVQNGGGNYGRYLPDVNVAANTFCNNIYHPSETTGSNQDSQLTIRIGNNQATDHFELYLESSLHWSDAMAAYIDWNRDGDFSDTGEFLGQIGPPPCFGQGNPTSGCAGAAQLAPHPTQTSALIQSGPPGEFMVPNDPSITVELGLTNLRVYSSWTGGTFSNPTFWDEPCRTATWGETEDFVVEIYDDVLGSAVASGSDFSYTPTLCGISEVKKVGANYTGFKVACTNTNGSPINTKFHFDVTKNTVY